MEYLTTGDWSGQVELLADLTHLNAISREPKSPQNQSMQHRPTRATRKTMTGTMMTLMTWIERRVTVATRTGTMV